MKVLQQDRKPHWVLENSVGLPTYEEDPSGFVRRALANRADVLKIPTADLEIFVSYDFLAPAECLALCESIDNERQPSELLAPADPDFRTSETCYFWSSSEIVNELESRIDAVMGVDRRYGERWQGQRYAVGQRFKPHYDFFHTDQPYWAEQQRMGGQRTWTVMVFLNSPEAGGETAFPQIGLRISPLAGSLVIWNNLDSGHRPNNFSLHEGVPVDAGLKYILTKWYREKPTPHAPPCGAEP